MKVWVGVYKIIIFLPPQLACPDLPVALALPFRHNTRHWNRIPCRKSCAFFSGLPSVCSERWPWPPSLCIAVKQINAMWLVVAAVATYAVGYRFYSSFISAKVLALDPLRATPAERLDNGRDFVPTNKWVVFGHHFAAIAGPWPAGRSSAGRAVRLSARHALDHRRRRAGRLRAGFRHPAVLRAPRRQVADRNGEVRNRRASAASSPTSPCISIIVILLGAIALIVVNALKSSPWGTFTIAMTMPIAVLDGPLSAPHASRQSARNFAPRIRAGARRHLRRTVGFAVALVGGGFYADRAHAGHPDHHLRIRRLGAARVAAARAARLPEHVRETRHHFAAGNRHRGAAAHLCTCRR